MWMGRKRVAHSRRCRRRAMCSAEASCPQPSQGRSVGTAIYKNGRARGRGRQMRNSTQRRGGGGGGGGRGKKSGGTPPLVFMNPPQFGEWPRGGRWLGGPHLEERRRQHRRIV